MIIEKQNGACVIDEPWFTGSRDLGELCFKVNFFGSPKSGSPNLAVNKTHTPTSPPNLSTPFY